MSLLTAIMPRLSRAAADGDTGQLVDDLSLAGRLSTVMLVPMSAVLTVAGSAIGVALFTYGNADVADARRLGDALAFSAFGLLPYALVMLQLRVFYAMKDARTPTLIMIVMTVVKVPLLYLCRDQLQARARRDRRDAGQLADLRGRRGARPDVAVGAAGPAAEQAGGRGDHAERGRRRPSASASRSAPACWSSWCCRTGPGTP